METFDWPWEYTFPPFFTLQPNEETRKRQIKTWADLFLNYHKHLNIYLVNIQDKTTELFYNKTINRRLTTELILLILEHLQSTGHASTLDKNRTEWLLYFYTLEEYANILYTWIQETGQINSVCTLYEITNVTEAGNMNAFQNIDERVLLKILRYLEEKNKCELIEIDGSYGAKFL